MTFSRFPKAQGGLNTKRGWGTPAATGAIIGQNGYITPTFLRISGAQDEENIEILGKIRS